jgi:hypothetical protein
MGRTAWIVPILLLPGPSGCGEDDVGVPCQLNETSSADAVQVNLQAFDCRSRLCIAYGDQERTPPLCTRICDDGDDCPDASESCPAGFACIHATNTGNAACCRMCVCRGLLPDSEAAALDVHCAAHPNPRCPGTQ